MLKPISNTFIIIKQIPLQHFKLFKVLFIAKIIRGLYRLCYLRFDYNDYSEHFVEMTLETKLSKMIKKPVWKKRFSSNALE